MRLAERTVLRRAFEQTGALLTELVDDGEEAHALVRLVSFGAVRLTAEDPPRVAGVNLCLLEWAGPTFPPKSVREARKIATGGPRLAG